MSDEEYMELAIAEAREAGRLGDVPIGAVVIDGGGTVIGRGANLRELWRDPTAHAEILAIRDAARVLGDWRLYGCRLFVTLEPCLMCAGAIVQSRIAQVVYGADNPKGGAVRSGGDVFAWPGLNHVPDVKAGVLREGCAIILEDFFRARRGG